MKNQQQLDWLSSKLQTSLGHNMKLKQSDETKKNFSNQSPNLFKKKLIKTHNQGPFQNHKYNETQ